MANLGICPKYDFALLHFISISPNRRNIHLSLLHFLPCSNFVLIGPSEIRTDAHTSAKISQALPDIGTETFYMDLLAAEL